MKLNSEADDQLILKALSGIQSGVEVILEEGEYTLGSGKEDDLQFVDVCLKSGHSRIRVFDGKVMIAGGAGLVTTQSGLTVAAGEEEWAELNPLEVVNIGTTKFAFGRLDANWSEIDLQGDTARPEPRRTSKVARPTINGRVVRLSLLAGGSVAAAISVVWFAVALFSSSGHTASSAPENRAESVREALSRFEFGASIEVREEADGKIFASGFVDELDKRRALHAALNETGVPVNLRIWVLSSMRSQIAAAVESFKVPVTFTLSDEGVVSFAGEIMSDEKAGRFLAYIRDEVNGLKGVESKIATAGSYFADVQALAERSSIKDTVFLRLVDQRIEATGVVVTDKLDSWVGFIQSYARRYADHIPLTSYVQLVNGQGEIVAEAGPTRLGAPELSGDASATALDLARLKQGSIAASDVFPGMNEGGKEAAASETVAAQPTTDSGKTTPLTAQSSLPQQDLATGAHEVLKGTAEDEDRDEVADAVLEKWDGAGDPDGRKRYLPLVLSPRSSPERCWSGSRLRVSDIPAVLFWLDYLSLSKDMSLVDFSMSNQYVLLEAALNPARTQRCAEKVSHGANVDFGKLSVYLDEAKRNPAFIRYLVRDFAEPPIAVAGVMLQAQERYIQLEDGTKVPEGSSPSVESKLVSIGTLGSLLQRDSDMAPVIYPPELAWKATDD